jgi:hypothetical protein
MLALGAVTCIQCAGRWTWEDGRADGVRTEDVEVVEVVVQLVEQLTPAVQCGAVPVRPVT